MIENMGLRVRGYLMSRRQSRIVMVRVTMVWTVLIQGVREVAMWKCGVGSAVATPADPANVSDTIKRVICSRC